MKTKYTKIFVMICLVTVFLTGSLIFINKAHVKTYGTINQTQNFGIVSKNFGGFEILGDFGYFVCEDQC